MCEFTYRTVAEHLVAAVPVLRPRYETERQWWGDEEVPPHIVFGDVLCPYLVTLLEQDDHEDTLRRIFMVLEQMAGHADEDMRDVVGATVCEYLCGSQAWLRRAHLYMGPATRAISQNVEARFGMT